MDRRIWMAALAALVGCAPTQGTWLAHGDVASVAVVRDGHDAVVYVCGARPENVGGWTRWFATSDWTGDSVSFERDGWLFRGDHDGDAMLVDVDGPGGQAGSWEAVPDAAGGLFVHDGDCRDGAIVQGGAITGAWCDTARVFHQVEPAGRLQDEVGDLIELQPVDVDGATFEATRFGT